MRFVRWLFQGAFRAEYNAGYRAAVDAILLLPAKVRLGGTLLIDDERVIANCSFVGGEPAIAFAAAAPHATIRDTVFSASKGPVIRAPFPEVP